MQFSLNILLLLISCLLFNELKADDPYCERRFDGQIIIVNKDSGAVHLNPSFDSKIMFKIAYGSVIDACMWDTHPDTLHETPGYWRKVNCQDTIGYVFSIDGYPFDSSNYQSEKIINIEGNSAISYNLFNTFYGIYETENGDSLLQCNIEFKRFTTNEINKYNEGSYYEMYPRWYHVATNKPYKCRFLISTEKTLTEKEINISTFTTKVNESNTNFDFSFHDCRIAIFNNEISSSKTAQGYEIFDYDFTIRTYEGRVIDTLFAGRNCYDLHRFIFDFYGDINNDNILDFVMKRVGTSSVYNELYISQGLKNGYSVLYE